MKQVLVLGAGLVARPLVRYLLEKTDVDLLIASRTVSKADALLEGHPKGRTMALNVKDDEALEAVIRDADVVISLLPYTFHVKVANHCLQHGSHLITTSYVSPAMRELDDKARKAGLLFLNEIGLDPGIDHMSAMQVIDDVKNKGGRVVSFESCCGGLPAPEANDNPFGYKFSWSPRGVVMAGRNPAHYFKDGKEVKIAGEDLFQHRWKKNVHDVGELVVYPNRDSTIYKDLYGLTDSETVFRGTFRYPGWSKTLYNLAGLGFLDETERPELENKSFAQVTASLVSAPAGGDLRQAVQDKLGADADEEVLDTMEWLGLFSEDPIKASPVTLLDILANRMQEKMPYRPGERDMIVLQHDFIAEYPNGSQETIVSLLVDFGVPNGDSAMSRTVSLPAAIATRLLTEDKLSLTGVRIPVDPEIYKPVLNELENLGIQFKEMHTPI
jgi:saccharopine dehydrogenase-like NADP-dependent oxidoreductase